MTKISAVHERNHEKTKYASDLEYIRNSLFELQDLKYKDFNKKLIPNVDEGLMIGIRVPVLRNFAKELYREYPEKCMRFLDMLPHKYMEENNLHGHILENMKNFREVLTLTEKFLPYIDNWATCDSFLPKVFKKHPHEVYDKIKIWIKSDDTYTVRYAIGLLLANFLDDEFKPEMLKLVAEVKSDEYYINMMVAWYFATALAKQRSDTMPFFEHKILEPWTHNKAIQKSIESRRISDEDKIYLRNLKVKIEKL